MDFTRTFEANTKCNNMKYVWSHFYQILVVLKYHRRLWNNIFDTDIFRCIKTHINGLYLAFFGIFMLLEMSVSNILFHTLISLIKVEPRLTNFEKFHPPQKKIPPPRLLISLLKCLILLQNLMTIFLTIILSYKTLFYHKNWCLLPPPHLVIFHFWHPSTFIPGSTFIREMRVHQLKRAIKI